MAKRRYVRVEAVLDGIERIGNRAPALLEEMQMEMAREGRDEMRRLIDTRGTGDRRWGYRYGDGDAGFVPTPLPAKVKPAMGVLKDAGGPSRVNTGRMRDSIRVRFEGQGARKVAAFGWIDAPADDEKYFQAQEYGFTEGGFRKPKKVEGVFALRDARRYVATEIMPRLVRKYSRRIARGR